MNASITAVPRSENVMFRASSTSFSSSCCFMVGGEKKEYRHYEQDHGYNTEEDPAFGEGGSCSLRVQIIEYEPQLDIEHECQVRHWLEDPVTTQELESLLGLPPLVHVEAHEAAAVEFEEREAHAHKDDMVMGFQGWGRQDIMESHKLRRLLYSLEARLVFFFFGAIVDIGEMEELMMPLMLPGENVMVGEFLVVMVRLWYCGHIHSMSVSPGQFFVFDLLGDKRLEPHELEDGESRFFDR